MRNVSKNGVKFLVLTLPNRFHTNVSEEQKMKKIFTILTLALMVHRCHIVHKSQTYTPDKAS
jgi:hypothetical protein